MSSNTRILITGVAGFVGSHLAEALVTKGNKVIGIDNDIKDNSYLVKENIAGKIRLYRSDVRNFDEMAKIVKNAHPDYVFHLAAQAIAPAGNTDPKETFETNILGTVSLLEAVRALPKIKGIAIASSDKAYGPLRKGKYKESFPLEGAHPYEASKSAADIIARSYFHTYKLPVVVTRFGNIYGEGDLHETRIVPSIMMALTNNETLMIRSNGKFVRDYLYVLDVVKGYLLLVKKMNKVKGEAFNFGSKESLSVLDLIKLVEKTLERKVKYKILNKAANELPYQSLDYAKATRTLGWKPEYRLKDTIEKIYNWYKDNI